LRAAGFAEYGSKNARLDKSIPEINACPILNADRRRFSFAARSTTQ
jgi:hypothetical protein